MTPSSLRPSPAVPFVLAGTTAVSILSTDLFTPSIPDLPAVFGTDIETAQRVVTINLAAYAVSHLVHGPVADAVGRRGILLGAFGFFVLASILCALAVSIEMLLVGRMLQGLFSSVPSVIVILVIRELYAETDYVRVMAIHGIAIGLAPALGPLIGGYLHVGFGWSASFWTIAVLATLVLVLFAAFVPESAPKRTPLRLGRAARDYGALILRGRYLRVLLSQSLVFGSFYAFVTTAPAVFIDDFSLPTERYGLIFLVIIAGFIAGNVLASRLSQRVSATALFATSIWLGALSAAALALPGLMGVASIATILAAMVPFAVALGIVLVAGPITLLAEVPDMAQGPASALLGTGQLGAAALASWVSSEFYTAGPNAMTLTMLGFCALGLVIHLAERPRLTAPGSDRGAQSEAPKAEQGP